MLCESNQENQLPCILVVLGNIAGDVEKVFLVSVGKLLAVINADCGR